jgi:UDP-N-acetylglucosamine--N-acetylmuramyl-(pentapeptide) pyrophosphoryl-undecaprenol N-acetylglucosamine transferase
MPAKTILFAGGGTGGHIYPAIAIASELKKVFPDSRIIFVGTDRGLEKDLVPKSGFPLKKIRVKGFERKLSFDTLVSVKEMFLGGFDSLKILMKEKPDLVVGTGGYVAGPIIFFASLLGIPSIIHEQNVKPGVTNRILSHFVKKIAISFPDSANYFPKDKIVLTGNPVRREIAYGNPREALNRFGLSPNLPVVLSFGGSQGAANLNKAILDIIVKIKDSRKFQLIHVTGKKNYADFINALEGKGIYVNELGHIIVKPYIYEMQDAYAAADLVISRAGAISISEITLCGKPAVLIPLPTAADNHQDYNAEFLQKNKAGVVISDKELTGEVLLKVICDIVFNKEKLRNMAAASRNMAKPNALDIIVDEIKKLVE